MISRRQVLMRSGAAIVGSFLPRALLAEIPRRFEGEQTFARLKSLASERRWARLPIGERIGEVGLALLKTPYVGSTLDVDDNEEVCVVSLDALDCVTFYEVALGFARLLHQGQPRVTPQRLVEEIRKLRYRNGRQDGYLSRLHYTSDWLYDNDRRGNVRLLSPLLPGAVHMDKPFDFMTSHPNSYRQLKAHPEWVPRLAAMEKEWSARRPMYVPKEVVPMVESLLETGDILGIATSAPGLDTSHTGLCYRDADGALRILHASTSHHQVELGPRLSEYLMSIKKDIGVMVARPLEL